MKLRLRSLVSKETQKLEVPDEFSIQQLKEFLSHSLSSTSSLASSLRFSLNRKDELSSPSPGDSLLSIGITSGDLIYYDFSSSSAQQGNVPSNLLDSDICNPIMDVKPCEVSEESDVVELICPNQQNELLRAKGKETLIENFPVEGGSEIEDEKLEIEGGSEIEDEKLEIEDQIGEECIDLETGAEGKRLSEPYFLKRVLGEDMGNDFSDTKLVFLAIHAVLLESGFVGFDSMSGLRVDLFDILKEKASMTFTTSVSYTLPQLLSDDNGTESIVLKFQTLGHYVNVYGSLAKSPLGLHKLNIDKSRYVPAIGTFWVTGDGRDRLNEIDSTVAYAEKVIFELWKFVKDGLALPLLIDLCEKTGLDLPPCLIRLPADLKFQILELLPGQDIARVACVCKEMKYLSSNNELWKEKYMSEFGTGTGAVLSHNSNWKARFASCWENTKKRKRIGLSRTTDYLLGPNPFGVPQLFPRHGFYPFGNPRVIIGDQDRQQRQYDLLAGRFQLRRIHNLGGFNA
ncbi:putative F-box protein At1g23770 [Euphorbia lathyris]|uniref:putative F-box protein At1g23770 n=1 Tax=Euphorbia lathyris TaxID=212925 RepID=UPI00331358B2